jgi:hypothetical protein
MAKLLVSTMLIEDLLFCGKQARIVGVTFDNYKLIFEIEGIDVPNVEVVRCITTKSIDVRFEPVE